VPPSDGFERLFDTGIQGYRDRDTGIQGYRDTGIQGKRIINQGIYDE